MTKKEILQEALKKHEVSHDIDYYIDDNENTFTAIYEAMDKYSKSKFPAPSKFEDWYSKNWGSHGSYGDCKALYEWIKSKIKT